MSGLMGKQSAGSKMSKQELSADLKRRAQEIDTKEAERVVKAIIVKFPDAGPKARQYVEDLGFRLDAEAVDTVLKSKKAKAIMDRTGQKRGRCIQDACHEGADPDDIIGKWQTIASMPVGILQEKVLAKLEVGTMSAPNLRAYAKLCGRGSTKVEMFKLFELATGADAELDLVGALSLWSGLVAYLMRECIARGRRCAQLDLSKPVDMQAKGIFSKEYANMKVTIVQRFTFERRVLALMQDVTQEDFDTISIKMPWSESRAILQFGEKMNIKPIKLKDLFHQTIDHIIESERENYSKEVQQLTMLQLADGPPPPSHGTKPKKLDSALQQVAGNGKRRQTEPTGAASVTSRPASPVAGNPSGEGIGLASEAPEVDPEAAKPADVTKDLDENNEVPDSESEKEP